MVKSVRSFAHEWIKDANEWVCYRREEFFFSCWLIMRSDVF